MHIFQSVEERIKCLQRKMVCLWIMNGSTNGFQSLDLNVGLCDTWRPSTGFVIWVWTQALLFNLVSFQGWKTTLYVQGYTFFIAPVQHLVFHLVRQTFGSPTRSLQGVSLPTRREITVRPILLLLLVANVEDLLVVHQLLLQHIGHTAPGRSHQLNGLLVQFPRYIDASKPVEGLPNKHPSPSSLSSWSLSLSSSLPLELFEGCSDSLARPQGSSSIGGRAEVSKPFMFWGWLIWSLWSSWSELWFWVNDYQTSITPWQMSNGTSRSNILIYNL